MTSVVVLETGLFDGLGLVSDSTAFGLGLVSVSDIEDSRFFFKTSQDHNCENITKLPVYCLIFLLTSLLLLDVKRSMSNVDELLHV